MNYKSLVPKKKYCKGLECHCEYNQALTDIEPLLAYVEKLELALDEIARPGFEDAFEWVSKCKDIARKARGEGK